MTRVVALFAALCLIAGFAAATIHDLKYWQNGVTLFSQAQVAWGRPDPKLEELYANALLIDDQVDEALRIYKESCVLGPSNQTVITGSHRSSFGEISYRKLSRNVESRLHSPIDRTWPSPV
jgi:hypothetical protein